MTANVRSLAAQRDKNQRDRDNRLLAEAEKIRAGLTSSDEKRRNSK